MITKNFVKTNLIYSLKNNQYKVNFIKNYTDKDDQTNYLNYKLLCGNNLSITINNNILYLSYVNNQNKVKLAKKNQLGVVQIRR